MFSDKNEIVEESDIAEKMNISIEKELDLREKTAKNSLYLAEKEKEAIMDKFNAGENLSKQDLQKVQVNPLELQNITGKPEWVWLPNSEFYKSTEAFLQDVTAHKKVDDWSLRFVHNNYTVPLQKKKDGSVTRFQDVIERADYIESERGVQLRHLFLTAAVLAGTILEFNLSLQKGVANYQKFKKVAEEQQAMPELNADFMKATKTLREKVEEFNERNSECRANLEKTVDGNTSDIEIKAASDCITSLKAQTQEIKATAESAKQVLEVLKDTISYQFGKYEGSGPAPIETPEGQLEALEESIAKMDNTLKEMDEKLGAAKEAYKMQAKLNYSQRLNDLKAADNHFLENHPLFKVLSDAGMTPKELFNYFETLAYATKDKAILEELCANISLETIKDLSTIKLPNGDLVFDRFTYLRENLNAMVSKISADAVDNTPISLQSIAERLRDTLNETFTTDSSKPIPSLHTLIHKITARISDEAFVKKYGSQEKFVNGIIYQNTNNKADAKPRALIINTMPDDEGFTFNRGVNDATAQNNIERVETISKVYQTKYVEATNGQAIKEAVQKAAQDGKISFVMVMGHGSQSGVAVEGFAIGDDLSYLDANLTPNAQIVVKACSTGRGRDEAPNFANWIANYAPGRNISAASEDALNAAMKFRVVDNEIEVSAINRPVGEKRDVISGNILYEISTKPGVAEGLCRPGKGTLLKAWCDAHRGKPPQHESAWKKPFFSPGQSM